MDAKQREALVAKVAELKASLSDMKKRNPAHCGGHSYVGHQMTAEFLEKIEDLEGEIKKLEGRLNA